VEVWEVFSAVVGGLCVGLIGASLARLPRSSVVVPIYCFVLSGFLWAVGDVIADTAIDIAWKQFGTSLLYTGSIVLPALWWIVVIRWSEEAGAGLPFRAPVWTHLPLAFAGVMWLVMITNPWHGAFLTPVVGGRNLYQPLWFVMSLPNYAMIVAAFVVEVEVARRASGSHVRRQAAFLISASLVTLIGNLVYVFDLVPLNPTTIVLSISGALLLVGMAREGLFGVLPLALPTIAADHPDGLVIVGLDDRIRFANERAGELLAPIGIESEAGIVGVLRDVRLRSESPELRRRASDDEWWASFVRLGGTTLRLNDEGHTRWLYVTTSIVHGRGGDTRGFYVQLRDLTKQKQAEMHLQQSRRLDSVATLARTVSRELQNIFAVIHGNGELLGESETLARDQQRRVSNIANAAKNGIELAYELQLYAGTTSTTRVLLELSEIAQDGCDFIAADLPNHIRVMFNKADEVLPVLVDAIQIRQSIFNLLMNAIDSMGDQAGDIEVSTGLRHIDPASENLICGTEEQPGEFAYVRIKDEGTGMDAGTEERAFDPFFTTHHKARGSGLATVLGIARAHDALLALENRDGCVFTLYLPLEHGVGSA